MSFTTVVIQHGFADTSSSKNLRKQFNKFCHWCWKHGNGSCDRCKKTYHKLYIPLRIAEKQKELGLPITRR